MENPKDGGARWRGQLREKPAGDNERPPDYAPLMEQRQRIPTPRDMAVSPKWRILGALSVSLWVLLCMLTAGVVVSGSVPSGVYRAQAIPADASDILRDLQSLQLMLAPTALPKTTQTPIVPPTLIPTGVPPTRTPLPTLEPPTPTAPPTSVSPSSPRQPAGPGTASTGASAPDSSPSRNDPPPPGPAPTPNIAPTKAPPPPPPPDKPKEDGGNKDKGGPKDPGGKKDDGGKPDKDPKSLLDFLGSSLGLLY